METSSRKLEPMKNTLFVSTYYNNPAFIDLQLKSFKKFVGDDFDLMVTDDSEDTTKSLVTGQPVRPEIRRECSRLGVRYVQVPQTIHATISNGGLVPNGFPANHPTERHRATLHWIVRNHQTLGFHEYKTVVLTESDLFVKKPINVSKYMEDYDLIGTGRPKVHLTNQHSASQYWPEEIKHLDEITVDFFTMYMLFVNMQRVNNLEQIDIGGFAGTDTGGKTSFFLKNNPHYKHLFLHIGNNREYQVDLFSKGPPGDDEAEFIHYRGGSNWDYQSLDYYREKLNRLLKRYVPDLYEPNMRVAQQNLTSRDGEHTFFKDK